MMENYRLERIGACKKGQEGEERLEVKTLNMWLTNMCNIHCVMCPFISADYENKTYYNELPHMVSLREFKKTMPKAATREEKYRGYIFSFMKGETLLNPELYNILKYIKKCYPKSEVQILSNGTIPPVNEKIVKYIDVLGFSIDAGTQEIFEEIRTPAKLSHVETTIRKWIRAKNKYNPSLLFRTSTTLSTLNMEDLPNVVKFIGEIINSEGGSWDSIYCQPVVIEDYQKEELKQITLDHYDKETGKKALEQTYALAKKYGIRLDMPNAIPIMFGLGEEKTVEKCEETGDKLYMQRFCRKLENGALSYDLDGKVGFCCCFMDKKYWRELVERYKIPDYESPDTIYNSEGYWKLREDLLEGRLSAECRDCQIGKSDYFEIEKMIRMEK